MDEGGERSKHPRELKPAGGERFTVKSRLVRIGSETLLAGGACTVTIDLYLTWRQSQENPPLAAMSLAAPFVKGGRHKTKASAGGFERYGV